MPTYNCSAFVNVTEIKPNSIRITACLDHFGHDMPETAQDNDFSVANSSIDLNENIFKDLESYKSDEKERTIEPYRKRIRSKNYNSDEYASDDSVKQNIKTKLKYTPKRDQFKAKDGGENGNSDSDSSIDADTVRRLQAKMLQLAYRLPMLNFSQISVLKKSIEDVENLADK